MLSSVLKPLSPVFLFVCFMEVWGTVGYQSLRALFSNLLPASYAVLHVLVTLEGVSHVEEEVSEIFRRISSGRRVNDKVSGGRFAMKMYRENIAQYLLLTWKESPRPLFHPNVVVDRCYASLSSSSLARPVP